MLVKKGDPETAKKIYANARLSETYQQWKYKEVLEKRITEANQNVAIFRVEVDPTRKNEKMMFFSKFACMGCHQN